MMRNTSGSDNVEHDLLNYKKGLDSSKETNGNNGNKDGFTNLIPMILISSLHALC